MRTWIYTLGGTISENTPTIANLQQILMKLLQERTCLLILDDVWQRTAAEKFFVGGASCRLLLTTRDTEIASELGATVYSIPPMTESEATRLLEAWVGKHLAESDPILNEQVVNRMG